MGYIFLPKFTQTGQQRYAHGEAIVNYLARKEAATHSGRRRKGETRKLDYALLGWAVSANWGGMGSTYHPILLSSVRAPEIARSGVLFSLQMHLSLGANTSLLGRSYSGGGAGGGAGGGGGGGW